MFEITRFVSIYILFIVHINCVQPNLTGAPGQFIHIRGRQYYLSHEKVNVKSTNCAIDKFQIVLKEILV
jgi:hypothetical protein